MTNTKDWRCRNQNCGKKLGEIAGPKIHIRIGRGREYIAHLPVTASCPACGTLTEAVRPPSGGGTESGATARVH